MPRMVSCKLLTATGAVKAAPGYVWAVSLAGPSAASGVILDDSTAGGGTNTIRLTCVNGGGESISFPVPVYFATGIYATLSGASANVTVAYE